MSSQNPGPFSEAVVRCSEKFHKIHRKTTMSEHLWCLLPHLTVFWIEISIALAFETNSLDSLKISVFSEDFRIFFYELPYEVYFPSGKRLKSVPAVPYKVTFSRFQTQNKTEMDLPLDKSSIS